MEDKRIGLHNVLCDILGSKNAYFQPPESVKMIYPAIVYSREDIEKINADDGAYLLKHRYSLTLIDEDPDSPLVDKILALPTCSFDRHYTKDNLNYDVFTLYF